MIVATARRSVLPRAAASGYCSASKAAPAPAPAASAPASAPASESAAPSDRLHSTDIAFKPTTDGWGYSRVYASGWDNIFKKKGKAEEAQEPPPPPPAATDVQLAAKLEALDKARAVGALSAELYERARRELS